MHRMDVQNHVLL